jgi:hypothetical protein
MPEPVEDDEVAVETVAEAIEMVAKGMVSQSAESGRSVSRIPIRDLIEADRHLAGKAAAAKPHFGLRFTKCIPPGGG